ncbi:ribosomal protein L40E [Nocardia transvalensis]|uniref:Ribosomal protein L40E n=1 Tax=Nocardia transvalensis TaxID=37333 RepID=A0A7W9P9I6_9NOCA|nr:ATP-binding protein [Nocardia transvalensis]MBB5912007.1 ribosomal protein L40E [Nocardia transvalensis]
MPDGQHIDITPHARILGVLGDIEFAQWQCLAELIDNAFDDFLSSNNAADAKPTVSIQLPSAQSTRSSAEVIVRDNGRGMSLERLERAISAGWSGNGRHGALGLFGMGFNIATARLGRKTTVRTSRAGDSHWIDVTLDLPAIEKSEQYQAPYVLVPKVNSDEHGTVVTISGLKADQWETLRRPNTQKKIREHLGDVYSYLLANRKFRLTVNGAVVSPRLPCAWDEQRTVTRSGVDISAIQRIDVPLSDKKVCMSCGYWNPLDVDTCRECGYDKLEVRPRRIWGWIGVQRYVHKTDYGIDFLRNGRKILLREKARVFTWTDEDDFREPELEYPIDTKTPAGRFVGEIHCDHVAPNYQKNAFEYETAEWRQVISAVRGDSPIRPKIAEKRGLPVNESPLARLFTGFRRNDPGLSYLIPGNGSGPIHERTIEWAKLFRDGVEEYQSDDIWYEAAYRHDHPLDTGTSPEVDGDQGQSDTVLPGLDDDSEDVPSSDDGGEPNVASAGNVPPIAAKPAETFGERLQRYRDNAEVLPDLSGEYALPELGGFTLKVWAVRNQRLIDSKEAATGAFAVMVRSPLLEVFVNVDHPLFREHGADIRDVALIEAADHRRTSTGKTTLPLTQLLAMLKDRASIPKLTPTALADESEQLLERIRTLMAPVIAETPAVHWLELAPNEQALVEKNFALESDTSVSWNDAVNSGEFIRFAPPTGVLRLIRRFPEKFMDGKVFRRPYGKLSDPATRELMVERVVNPLHDLVLLANHRPKVGSEELARIRYSCRLVARDLADEN